MANLVRCFALYCCLSGFGAASFAQTVTPVGLPLLEPCKECHGIDGVGLKPEVPHLDRQVYVYLQESIELLKSGKRLSAVAQHIPEPWTTADIQAAARYYNRLQGVRPVEPVDSLKEAQGKEVFLEKCEACHEDGGRRTDYRGTGSAILAGQNKNYLASQIRAYLTGQRPALTFMKKNSFLGTPLSVNGNVVGARLEKVADADVEPLAHYLAAQRAADPVSPQVRKRR